MFAVGIVIVVFCLSLLLILAGISLGIKRANENIKRRGIILFNVKNTDFFGRESKNEVVIEVGETEQVGEYSRVKILSMSGIESGNKRNVADLVGSLIPTKDIRWLNEKEEKEKEAKDKESP